MKNNFYLLLLPFLCSISIHAQTKENTQIQNVYSQLVLSYGSVKPAPKLVVLSEKVVQKTPAFYNAIKKYGWENIYHEVVAGNLTEEEAKKFEITLISKLKSNDKHFGYNCTAGGDGSVGFRHSDETKRRISQLNKVMFCLFFAICILLQVYICVCFLYKCNTPNKILL